MKDIMVDPEVMEGTEKLNTIGEIIQTFAEFSFDLASLS